MSRSSVCRAIDAVGPVKRETMLAGLKIFKPKRDLRLPCSNTQFLVLGQEGQEDIGIERLGVGQSYYCLVPVRMAPKSG